MNVRKTTRQILEEQYEELSMNLFLDTRKKEIIKICKIYDTPDLKTKYDNFIRLMEFLNKTEHFRELVKPKELIQIPGYDTATRTYQQRMGYTMDSLKESHITLEDIKPILEIEEKRIILLEIGEIINEIKKHNIVYGDLHDANIMIGQNRDIRFIDADCVQVQNVNTDNLALAMEHEKRKLVTLVLETLYDGDFSFNVTRKLSEKIEKLEMTPRLRGYIKSLEAGEMPEGYITEYYDDFANDVLEYNLRLTNKRNF